MRTQWNWLPAAVTVVVLSGAASAHRVAGDSCPPGAGLSVAVDRMGIPAGGRNGLWRAHLAGAALALAPGQHFPAVPAGARVVVQAPPTETTPDVFRIPVRTGSHFPHSRVDRAKVERTTAQLESQLKAVQPEMAELSKGELAADLIPRLKRIEKLSKELRRQIDP